LTPAGTLEMRVRPPMPDPKASHALQVLARALGRLGRERARSGDVTPQQAEALQLLSERGPISTSVLASMLGIDPSTASRNLAGLERAGYIVRKRGADDGRQTDVRLTPRGKRTAEALSVEWTLAYTTLLDRLPRAERQRIADVLEVLARVLDEDAAV
jgi:DNA-binding MarR family transcriptional regulator